MKKKQKNLWHIESYVLLSATICLLAIGLVMVLSASFVHASANEGNPLYYAIRQLVFLVLGIVIAVVAYYFSKNADLRKVSLVLWAFSLVFLLLTFIPGLGKEVAGAKRWLIIGSFRLQPSEICKVTLIIFVASLITSLEKQKGDLKIRDLSVVLGIMSLTALLVFFQPDYSTMALIFIGGLTVIFFSRIKLSNFLLMIVCFVPLAILAVLIEPYRVQRLLVFLNPWGDSQGSGYQIVQSLYALAMGGLNGVGIGLSKQKYLYLPAPHTDFIFSIIGEELGFIGVMMVVMLFIVFFISGMRLAFRVKDTFSQKVILALTTLITIQAIINMGAATSFLPVTGVTLPFVSYGGTSLIIVLASVGIIVGLSAKGDINEVGVHWRRDGGSRAPGFQRYRVIEGKTSSD